MKYLLILRGLPGSGKTTYANRVLNKFMNIYGSVVYHCSADNYFVGDDGVYRFDHSRLGMAHSSCRDYAKYAMESGIPLVVIDNTNTTNKEMKPYVDIAKEYGYIVKYKVVGCLDDDSIDIYFKRNIHNVPLDSIKKMARRLIDSTRER